MGGKILEEKETYREFWKLINRLQFDVDQGREREVGWQEEEPRGNDVYLI